MQFNDKLIIKALDACKANNLSSIILGIPYQLTKEEIFYLKNLEIVNGLVLYCPPPEVTKDSKYTWLGCFNSDSSWTLPACLGTIVFIGSPLFLSKQMLWSICFSGRLSIIAKNESEFTEYNILILRLNKTANRLHSSISSLHHKNKFRKLVYFLKEVSIIKKFLEKFYMVNLYDTLNNQFARNPTVETYQKIFEVVEKTQKSSKNEKVKKILLVNNGLAAGGAEKQIVNTLIGLEKSKQFCEIELLCEYIGHSKDLDFFLEDLKDSSVKISKLEKKYLLSDNGLASLSPPIAQIVKTFPLSIIEDILNLVYFFKKNKPDVVHAWQDLTSLKVALAAIIAGINRIIISGRNVRPTNFNYYQNFFDPIYKALASNKRIIFLNNSYAGAEDYCNWLCLNKDRIKVIRNGIIFDHNSTDIKECEVDKYKSKLNISKNKIIIGSIFRFWEEKDPLLFLKTAKILLKRNQNIHFLVIGDGPLRDQMEQFIINNAMQKFVSMPGTIKDVSLALSAFDIFLLTSLFEGTPNVLIEAQFFGLPVVSTDAGGSKETYDINETGFLANNRDPEELALLIQNLVDNEDLRIKIRKKAPLYVKNNFGFDKMIKNTIDIYNLKDNA